MSMYLIGAALLAVLLVLLFGVGQFAIGRHNPSRSNRFMQLRVALQALAILLILGALALGLIE